MEDLIVCYQHKVRYLIGTMIKLYKISDNPAGKMFSRFDLKSIKNEKVTLLMTLLESLNDLLSNPLDYEDFSF